MQLKQFIPGTPIHVSCSAMMRQLVYLAASLLVLVAPRIAGSCPVECRCLDHDSIVNCHHAEVDRLPSPLPPAAIVIDADRNRISALYSLVKYLCYLLHINTSQGSVAEKCSRFGASISALYNHSLSLNSSSSSSSSSSSYFRCITVHVSFCLFLVLFLFWSLSRLFSSCSFFGSCSC